MGLTQRKAASPNPPHDGAMMQSLLGYLAMGGYAAFVWPAYAVASLVLAGLFWQSVHAYRRRQRELERLQQGRPRRGSAA